jgi:hypothetical protein
VKTGLEQPREISEQISMQTAGSIFPPEEALGETHKGRKNTYQHTLPGRSLRTFQGSWVWRGRK